MSVDPHPLLLRYQKMAPDGFKPKTVRTLPYGTIELEYVDETRRKHLIRLSAATMTVFESRTVSAAEDHPTTVC